MSSCAPIIPQQVNFTTRKLGACQKQIPHEKSGHKVIQVHVRRVQRSQRCPGAPFACSHLCAPTLPPTNMATEKGGPIGNFHLSGTSPQVPCWKGTKLRRGLGLAHPSAAAVRVLSERLRRLRAPEAPAADSPPPPGRLRRLRLAAPTRWLGGEICEALRKAALTFSGFMGNPVVGNKIKSEHPSKMHQSMH